MPTTSKSQQDGEPGQKAEAPDPRDARIAELESQLAEARRPSRTFSGAPVRMKVEPPHSELHYAGRVVGTEYTEVPASQAAAFLEAAAAAGVTLTQDLEG